MPVELEVLQKQSISAAYKIFLVTCVASITWSKEFLSVSRSMMQKQDIQGLLIELGQGLNSLQPRFTIYNKVASLLKLSTKVVNMGDKLYGKALFFPIGIEFGDFLVINSSV